MKSLQQIIRDILLTFNPISLFIAVGLVMLVYLLMLSRTAKVKNRRGFFRNLILPLTIILPLLVSLVFFLITSTFIEWPNSYNEAIWTQKNGK